MQKTPSVCVFIESYYPQVGGTTTHARLLARDLSRQGLAHLVITRRLTSEVPREEQVDGIRVIRVGPVGHGSLKKWGMLFTALPALFKYRCDFDLIYVPGFRVLGVLAVLFARCFRKRCVLRGVSCGEMSGAFFDDSANRLPWVLQKLFHGCILLRNSILRRADSMVAISLDLENELISCGVSDTRVARIPNAVDTNLFMPVLPEQKSVIRQKMGLSPDSTVVIYTGRLVRYKGLLPLLEAWKILMRALPSSSLHLVLVGAGGNDIHNCEDELKQFVAQQDLSDSVRFTGDVEAVAPYLQASDIFVFPTENEAFGISLIEAMACGLPSVSTDVGGVKDIVSDGENALVVPVQSPEALARALQRLLGDSALSERLGVEALATVMERYTSTAVGERYRELFCRVAAGSAKEQG